MTMKIKIMLVATILLAVSSFGFAQAKPRTVNPNVIIKNLYAAQKSGAGPFFQTKSRVVVDKYFRKDLADLIWQDAVKAKGEVGAIDFDPLYGSQDPQITKFVIMDTGWGGDAKFGPATDAVVQVTFKDSGKERMVSYQFRQGKDQSWKIYDVHYREDGNEVRLAEVLRQAKAADRTSSGNSEEQEIQGKLQVGKTESVILYVGMESGDYAAYCFDNNSAGGQKILAACKNGGQCKVTGTVVDHNCKVPGLEADLSASGKIATVKTARALGRRRS